MDRSELKHLQHLYRLPQAEGNARALDEIMGKLIENQNMLKFLLRDALSGHVQNAPMAKEKAIKEIMEGDL